MLLLPAGVIKAARQRPRSFIANMRTGSTETLDYLRVKYPKHRNVRSMFSATHRASFRTR